MYGNLLALNAEDSVCKQYRGSGLIKDHDAHEEATAWFQETSVMLVVAQESFVSPLERRTHYLVQH